MERQHRRLRTQAAETAWRDQFRRQRRLYEDKFTSYWCETVDKYRNDAEGCSQSVACCQTATERPTTVITTTKLSANEFADFFRDKIAIIRQSIVTATPPIIVPRRSVPAL